jgi:biopolymer transport protein ExbD
MQPPLTPMIDVVFQLLLFFLLGCKFIQEEGQIRANLPNISGPSRPSLNVDPVKIQLSAAGMHDESVLIQVTGAATKTLGEPKEVWDLLMGLRNRLQPGQDQSEVPVVITPQGRVRWRFVVDTFNQAVRANYKNVAFSPPTS